jgi:hypothetical protein
MTAKNALAVIGKKLEKEYKRIGFKYSKRNRFLKKITKKYEYYILFSSFPENISDACINLHVVLAINDRTLLKINKYLTSKLFCMDLWEMGNHYSITNETSIDTACTDLRNKIEDYLVSQIKILEGENLRFIV